MPDKIIQVDEVRFEMEPDRLVAAKVSELPDAMPDAEADEIAGTGRHERDGGRRRSGRAITGVVWL